MTLSVTVLVTGASGFIGSYVCDRLEAEGYKAEGFDRVANLRTTVLGDVKDAGAVDEAVARCDGVIHCAGILGTAETIARPTSSVRTNIIGSLNVFDACRHYSKPCVYITVGNYWMLNSYSITKTAAEQIAWMFNKEHGTKIAVVRALNAYGPRQKQGPVRKIMPNFIVPALSGEPLVIYGDGEQVMDMIWVEDVADVLVRALVVDHGQYIYRPMRSLDNPVKFEAGTGRMTTVNEIARLVLLHTGARSVIKRVPMRAGEPENSVVLGDPDTLKPLYGGTIPKLLSLEEGIERTVRYYRGIA
jgi:nucleoside-diphosphate-sugar epimerase